MKFKQLLLLTGALLISTSSFARARCDTFFAESDLKIINIDKCNIIVKNQYRKIEFTNIYKKTIYDEVLNYEPVNTVTSRMLVDCAQNSFGFYEEILSYKGKVVKIGFKVNPYSTRFLNEGMSKNRSGGGMEDLITEVCSMKVD